MLVNAQTRPQCNIDFHIRKYQKANVALGGVLPIEFARLRVIYLDSIIKMKKRE